MSPSLRGLTRQRIIRRYQTRDEEFKRRECTVPLLYDQAEILLRTTSRTLKDNIIRIVCICFAGSMWGTFPWLPVRDCNKSLNSPVLQGNSLNYSIFVVLD